MALASSVVATVVSAMFAWQLLRRWSARGRTPASLYWGIALVMFSVASAALLLGVVAGWDGLVFRVFYLFGAVLNVLWLALGSAAIVARRKVVAAVTGGVTVASGLLFGLIASGSPDPLLWIPSAILAIVLGAVLALLPAVGLVRAALLIVAGFTALAAVGVVTADFVIPLPTEGLPEGREVFPLAIRGLAVAGNAVGSIVVIVAAIASSAHVVWTRPDRAEDVVFKEVGADQRAPVEALARWLFAGRRRSVRGAGHVVRGNLLIALGVIVAAMGGTLSFGGDTTGHAVGLALGVAIMYLGFIRTVRPFEDVA